MTKKYFMVIVCVPNNLASAVSFARPSLRGKLVKSGKFRYVKSLIPLTASYLVDAASRK
jgi:hypothetical protein